MEQDVASEDHVVGGEVDDDVTGGMSWPNFEERHDAVADSDVELTGEGPRRKSERNVLEVEGSEDAREELACWSKRRSRLHQGIHGRRRQRAISSAQCAEEMITESATSALP